MTLDPVCIFPDVVALLCGYLGPILDPVIVRDQVPNPRPSSLVTIRRTGGPAGSLVHDLPQLTVDSWAPKSSEAHDLAQLVRAHLHRLRGTTQDGVAFYRVTEFSGPFLLPDPLSDYPRYSQTFQLGLRGRALTP